MDNPRRQQANTYRDACLSHRKSDKNLARR